MVVSHPCNITMGLFTLQAWDHQKLKSLHFAKSTSPVCLDHLVKSLSPHCWIQANSIFTNATSHQVRFLFLNAKILFKLPEIECFTNCSTGEMYSLAAQRLAPKNKRLPNFQRLSRKGLKPLFLINPHGVDLIAF